MMPKIKKYTAYIAVIGEKNSAQTALLEGFKKIGTVKKMEQIPYTFTFGAENAEITNFSLPEALGIYQKQVQIEAEARVTRFDESVNGFESTVKDLMWYGYIIAALDLSSPNALEKIEDYLEVIPDDYKKRPIMLVGITQNDTNSAISKDKIDEFCKLYRNSGLKNISYVRVNPSSQEEVKKVFDVAVTQAVQQSFEQDFPDAKKKQELREKLEAYIKRVHGYQKGQATAKVTSSSAFFPPNSHEATPASDKLPDLNELLSQENLKKIDFERGFSCFGKNQGLNRKANYILAIELLEKLNNGEKIDSVFSNLDGQRNSIFTKYDIDKPTILGANWGRGIQSPELKSIIKEASEYIEKSSSSGLGFKK